MKVESKEALVDNTGMEKGFRVAVVGATGAVGEVFMELLQERRFPLKEVFLLASERSAGETRPFAGREVRVRDLASFDFATADLAFFSAGAKVSAHYAPLAAQAGALVIDNSSYFRQDPEVPLAVPEVNPEALWSIPRQIVANPNCSTAQMVVALKPIHDAAGISRVNVATYQSVSGAGRRAVKELAEETRAVFTGAESKPQVFPKSIAFNVLPQIDVFMENGYTKEEMKMVWETQKILEDASIAVNPTCVRVPVFYGHSLAVHVETRRKITAEEARALWQEAPGIMVMDSRTPGGYPTPKTDAAGKDPVFVGRIREDLSCPQGLNFWVVADNLRKGAALNALQIAEILMKTGRLQAKGGS